MQLISVWAVLHGYKHKGLKVVISSLLYFKINSDFPPLIFNSLSLHSVENTAKFR